MKRRTSDAQGMLELAAQESPKADGASIAMDERGAESQPRRRRVGARGPKSRRVASRRGCKTGHQKNESRVLLSLPRRDGNEHARVTLDVWRGHVGVSTRAWWQRKEDDGGGFLPTRKGVVWKASELEDVIAALEQARALIANGAFPSHDTTNEDAAEARECGGADAK